MSRRYPRVCPYYFSVVVKIFRWVLGYDVENDCSGLEAVQELELTEVLVLQTAHPDLDTRKVSL